MEQNQSSLQKLWETVLVSIIEDSAVTLPLRSPQHRSVSVSDVGPVEGIFNRIEPCHGDVLVMEYISQFPTAPVAEERRSGMRRRARHRGETLHRSQITGVNL